MANKNLLNAGILLALTFIGIGCGANPRYSYHRNYSDYEYSYPCPPTLAYYTPPTDLNPIPIYEDPLPVLFNLPDDPPYYAVNRFPDREIPPAAENPIPPIPEPAPQPERLRQVMDIHDTQILAESARRLLNRYHGTSTADDNPLVNITNHAPRIYQDLLDELQNYEQQGGPLLDRGDPAQRQQRIWKLQAAIRCLQRLSRPLYDHPERHTGLTLVQTVALVRQATQDTTIFTTQNDREDQLQRLVRALAESQRAHNLITRTVDVQRSDGITETTLVSIIDFDPATGDFPSCAHGTYKRLYECLDNAHPDVRLTAEHIPLTDQDATRLLQEVSRELFGRLFHELTTERRRDENIQAIREQGEVYINYFNRLREATEQRQPRLTHEQFNRIVTPETLETFIEDAIDHEAALQAARNQAPVIANDAIEVNTEVMPNIEPDSSSLIN